MAITQNTSSIPESITLGGVTYAVKDTPELQQFIQAVAKVEKSKVYSQMEAIKQQIQSLSNVEVVKDGSEFNVDSLIEKLKGTFVTTESLKESLSDTIKEVVQPVLDATHKHEQDELSAYREKLISENASTCIPDLVKGNTKEELDASLQESIRLRSAYPSPGTQSPTPDGPIKDPNLAKLEGTEGFTPEPNPTPQGADSQSSTGIPNIPNRPSPSADGQGANVKSMSAKEFAEKRDILRQQLENMYGGSSL